MKIGGHAVTPPSEHILVFKRDPHPVVFRARALPDLERFHSMCPEPEPPKKLIKGTWAPDFEQASYTELLQTHVKQRIGFMVVHTLEPSEIEWDTVDVEKPNTWAHWEKDLRGAGLTQIEVNKVGELVLEANCLDEEKLIEAREHFLLGQALAQSESSSQSSEQATTPSGEPASDSE